MANIVTLKTPFREDWLYQLGDVITDPDELLTLLALNDNAELQSGREARRLFPLRVPRAFVARMQPGDPQDPLLLQVLTAREEFIAAPGFTTDPLDEHGHSHVQHCVERPPHYRAATCASAMYLQEDTRYTD